MNFSGLLYHAVHFGVRDDGYIDYDGLRSAALTHRPRMIVAGASAYPRTMDFAAFAEVAREVWLTGR